MKTIIKTALFAGIVGLGLIGQGLTAQGFFSNMIDNMQSEKISAAVEVVKKTLSPEQLNLLAVQENTHINNAALDKIAMALCIGYVGVCAGALIYMGLSKLIKENTKESMRETIREETINNQYRY